MKKSIFFILFLFFFGMAVADSISDYTVPTTISFNQDLTIYGLFSGTPLEDVLCTFLIFDVNKLVERLDDQYTNSLGAFTARPYKITESKFQDNTDYNAITQCGNTEIGLVFKVQSPAFGISINYGQNETTNLINDLNLTAPLTTTLMAFSCDDSNWSAWEPYKNLKKDFDLGSGLYGCEPRGQGLYVVYASFTDGATTNESSDLIYAKGIDKNQALYVSPDEIPATETKVTIPSMDFSTILIGLIIIGAIVFVIYYSKKKAQTR